MRSGTGWSARSSMRRARSPRATRAGARRRARCRGGTRSRRRSRRRTATAGCRRRARAARRRPARRARTRRTRSRRRTRRRRSPTRSCARTRSTTRARATGAYQSLPRLRCASLDEPSARCRSSRTSLPGGAVVPSRKRWRARRSRDATPFLDVAFDAGRHARGEHRREREQRRAGRAPGSPTSSRTIVTPSRRIQPAVENNDMNRWSSVNTWSRSTLRRSRYSGRSWCSIVGTDACRRATCDSRKIVTRSRKRRCARSPTTLRNQVAVGRDAEAGGGDVMSRAVVVDRRRARCSFSHSASSASGSAANSDHARTRTRGAAARRGSRASPAATSTDRPPGRSSGEPFGPHAEDVIGLLLAAPSSPKRDAWRSNIVR